MAVHDIRESLENSLIVSTSGLTIIQKKVELKRGMRHEVLACDIFQDAVLSTDSPYAYLEFFVTPYPVIYSNMDIAPFVANRGPVAASDSVLFKANMDVQRNNEGNFTFNQINQFPSPQISAGPSFSFYTPFVYFTAFVHGDFGSQYEDMAFSFLLRVNSSKATNTSYGLGLIRERSVAQGINLMNQGRIIPKAANVGQIFPAWKYGGIRPERMILGTAARNFWLNYSADSSESMITTGSIRNYLKNARTMQDFETAFGDQSATLGDVPDWIRFGLNRGLVSGPVRAQQPPRKLADNGNTLMF
ncbi:MAG: hypothetical protein [Circular genetic element sp.]|nr:MAG: hypothetical protein [Circular genetic element sp.]